MKIQVSKKFSELYGEGAILFASPGRINLIGEHTDYNGGFVFPGAVDKGIVAAIKLNGTDKVRAYALDLGESSEFGLSEADKPAQSWACYIFGVCREIQKRGGKIGGFDTVFAGDVPLAAVIAVMAQISIPMPLGVPMTMQTFAITLAAVVLGSKLSAIASLVYLALGAVGVPVLANFSGGFDKFVGPTGGFLISFPLMAYIIGLGVEHRNAFKGAFVTAVIVGTVVNYVVGVAMFVVVAHSTIVVGITACVLPFIPTAIIKAVLACAIGLNLRKRIPGLKA